MSLTPDDIRAHSYVDGELDPYERARLFEELLHSPERNREVAELGELKALVRLAFERPPAALHPPAVQTRGALRTCLKYACAGALALMLLVCAFAAGWFARGGGGALQERLAALGGVQIAGAAAHTPGVLLHLASFERKDASATLARARELLSRYRGRGLKVEVVINGTALEFLDAAASPYSHQFAWLMRRYPNLEVVACGLTLAALRKEGQLLPLPKGVRVAPSAVREVVRRLEEGWTYVES